ncbi:MAG: hypothetical protein CMQ49_14930 [Gammaproteobacteria bacterium]|nr:hypothetical protein [Gammaproteobacteria bacterium]
MSAENQTTTEPLTQEAIQEKLERRGHIVTSWDEIGAIELPTTAVASMYRIGLPDNEAAPTVFKMWFPPGCTIEAHTHACDYSEIILAGSQKVGAQWLYPGDIRVGLANKGYGPLVAGPEGASVLVIFADGRWPGIALGKNDGSTLGTAEITDRYTV